MKLAKRQGKDKFDEAGEAWDDFILSPSVSTTSFKIDALSEYGTAENGLRLVELYASTSKYNINNGFTIIELYATSKYNANNGLKLVELHAISKYNTKHGLKLIELHSISKYNAKHGLKLVELYATSKYNTKNGLKLVELYATSTIQIMGSN